MKTMDKTELGAKNLELETNLYSIDFCKKWMVVCKSVNIGFHCYEINFGEEGNENKKKTKQKS